MTISRVDEQKSEGKSRRKDRGSSMGQCERPSEGSGKEDVIDDDGVKRYYGDGLVVKMDSNSRMLKITGDGCHVVLSKNSGSVHVVGDGCRLSVNHNVGDIEYIGDGGSILLGPDSSKEKKVKYVGEGGKVIFDAAPEMELPTIEYRCKRYCAKEYSRSFSKERRNYRGFSYVPRIACSCEEVVEETASRCEERYDNDRMKTSSRQEDLDNVANEAKERNRGKYGMRNDETRKSPRHQTVAAKIITKIQTGGRCVRKRFGDSSLVVNSTSGSRPVTSVSRASDTSTEIK